MSGETYTDEQIHDAREAFKTRHPDWQPNTTNDALEASWLSGYIACWNDLLARLEKIVGPLGR